MNSFRWLLVWPFLYSLLACQLVAAVEQEAVSIEQVRIGIDGRFKVGYWTPVWITVAGGKQFAQGKIDVVAPDSDEVPVRYFADHGEFTDFPAEKPVSVCRYVKLGRIRSRLQIEIRDNSGTLIANKTVSLGELSQSLSPSQRFLVTLGSDIGMEQVTKVLALSENENIGHTHVTSTQYLPDQWLGYEGVNTIFIATGGDGLPKDLSPPQVAAIRDWLRLGGRLVMSVGQRGPDVLAPESWLAEFAPGKFKETTTLRRATGLESFVSASENLNLSGEKRLIATTLSDMRGKSEVFVGAGGVGDIPLVIRAPFGLGQVVFVALDPDLSPLSGWSGRTRLIARIIQEESRKSESSHESQKWNAARQLGFDDMVGQLRASLDQFSKVALVPFSWIAILLVGYLLLLGPGDFFLVRMFHRPHVTWFTFPLLVLVMASVVVSLARKLKDDRLRINQAEVVDIDTTTGVARGTAWAHIYSSATDSFNVGLEPPRQQLKLDQQHSLSSLLSWQGMPGRGLGGLSSANVSSLLTEGYQSEGLLSPTSVPRLQGVPIQIASTKSLVGRWWGEWPSAEKPSSNLWNRFGYDGLDGEVTNPLNVELHDPAVLYEKWIYPLDRNLAPGETVALGPLRNKQRNLEWRLTRRNVTADNKETTAPWDAHNLQISRVMEVMMFHGAAGGASYTRLPNRYQSYVDLSEHLRLGRAILLGRSEQPAAVLTRDGQPLQDAYEQRWTYYRVVFPVETKKAGP